LTTKLTQPLRRKIQRKTEQALQRAEPAWNRQTRAREFAPCCYVPVSVVKERARVQQASPLTPLGRADIPVCPEGSKSLPAPWRACPPWAGNKKPGAKRRAVRRYAARHSAKLEAYIRMYPSES
jgi:hypothetical protein